MNLAATDDPSSLRPENLPAPRRGERFRVLFVTGYSLGFRTLASQFEQYTAQRDDVEAVHLRLQLPPRLEWAGKVLARARGWDLAGWRRLRLWAAHLPGVIARHTPPDRFDAAILTTQGIALGMRRVKAAFGLPYAVYIDTTAAQYARDLGGSRIPEQLCVRADGRVFGDADLIAGMSRWSLDSVRDDYGVPESKLLVVHNSVPVPANIIPRPESVAGAPVRLAIVGNGWIRKGGDRLLRWHQERWKDRAELHVFGADVPIDRSLTGVVWHGRVEHARLVNDLLPSMDIFVLPTRNDMSPWAVVEAAGRGLPVVSSRLGAIHEIVDHGRTGFLCAPTDDGEYIRAIESLMPDPMLRRSMGQAAHRHMLAEFSPDGNYGRLIDRMRAIASAAGPGRSSGAAHAGTASGR